MHFKFPMPGSGEVYDGEGDFEEGAVDNAMDYVNLLAVPELITRLGG